MALVKQDSDGFWLAVKLAAQKSGLTKKELARRANAGELRCQLDWRDEPEWYAEDQITALAIAHLEAQRAKAAKPKRQPTAKQIEARFRYKMPTHVPQQRGPERLTMMGEHFERVILTEIAENNKKK